MEIKQYKRLTFLEHTSHLSEQCTHGYENVEIEVNIASYNYYTIEKNVISKYGNHIAYKKYEHCKWNEIDTFSLLLNVFPENLNHCNILCKVTNQ